MRKSNGSVLFPCFNQFHKKLSISDAWKRSISDIRAKHRYISIGDESDGSSTVVRVRGWIKPEHCLMYNIAMGKSVDNGFTPRMINDNSNASRSIFNKLPKEKRVRDRYNRGLNKAFESLSLIIGFALDVYQDQCNLEVNNMTGYKIGVIDEFLEPFEGTISTTDLCSIDRKLIEKKILATQYS